MFAITSNRNLIGICSTINYVKFDEQLNNHVLVDDESDATGIILNEKIYNITNDTTLQGYEGIPTAQIEWIGHGDKFIFNTHVKATRTEEDVITVEDAILNLNGTTQEDLDDLRGAIFDLAKQIANNQE